MADILSQNQIDNLLKGINSGDIEEEKSSEIGGKKVKEYDFRSPKKFTKEQLRTMDSLHENLSRLLSSYLSGVLRCFCEVSVLQIEEQRYYEFNNALPDSALIGLLDMKPQDKNINESTLLVDLAPSIAYFMIDRLLGGSGESYSFSREFSEIELSIMEHEFQRFAHYIQEAWRDYIDIECTLGSLETNTRLIQIYAPEDIVVIVALNVKIRKLEGTLTICIPAVGLEEMMADFISKYTRMIKRTTDETKEQVRKQLIMTALNRSDLELKAVINEVQLDMSDLLQLQVDDVIPLGKSVKSDVCIKVDNVPWFYGKLGSVKSKKALKLTGLIQH
ncbi:MAG: flagellar motor switch protein FliM [Angelakisella sp.]